MWPNNLLSKPRYFKNERGTINNYARTGGVNEVPDNSDIVTLSVGCFFLSIFIISRTQALWHSSEAFYSKLWPHALGVSALRISCCLSGHLFQFCPQWTWWVCVCLTDCKSPWPSLCWIIPCPLWLFSMVFFLQLQPLWRHQVLHLWMCWRRVSTVVTFWVIAEVILLRFLSSLRLTSLSWNWLVFF